VPFQLAEVPSCAPQSIQDKKVKK